MNSPFNRSISNLQAYHKYTKLSDTFSQRQEELLQLTNNEFKDKQKTTAEDLISLKEKYPDNFDYLITTQNSDGKLVVQEYNFNLYEAVHFKCIPKLVKKWYLDHCTYLTLGSYIHDEKLYKDFIKYSFPSKVKDLKIIYHKNMGECMKIWYDDEFIKNAGRVTDEVRLCLLQLDEVDIAYIFKLFNHVKSIWFLECHLNIDNMVSIK